MSTLSWSYDCFKKYKKYSFSILSEFQCVWHEFLINAVKLLKWLSEQLWDEVHALIYLDRAAETLRASRVFEFVCIRWNRTIHPQRHTPHADLSAAAVAIISAVWSAVNPYRVKMSRAYHHHRQNLLQPWYDIVYSPHQP